MAWLLLAYCDYRQTYKNNRYDAAIDQLRDLLKSWYIDNPNGPGGYVQHGWRRGDSQLHEKSGHHEGNIDCYAVFLLLGETQLAEKIHAWLENELSNREDLPLDLYTWRSMAERDSKPNLLDVPDFDLRYRKTVDFHGHQIVGPYHSPAPASRISGSTG